MRIIAGRHRGTKLTELVGASTRPTADRVRENLFNILAGGRYGEVIADATIIDGFAGTGALGLEALSRGAGFCSFLERDQAALRVLRRNIDRLDRTGDAAVIAGDALTLASWRGQPATLLLADAPYGSGGGQALAIRLATIGALDDGAIAVIETGQEEPLDEDALTAIGFVVDDSRRYGRARLHFLKFTTAD